MYEGYAPHGVAVMVEAVTDNRNRTVSDLRTTLTRGGGSLGESGSVAWQFDNKGLIALEVKDADPEEIALIAIDAGADDVRVVDTFVEVYTGPTDLDRVRRELADAGLTVASAELAMLPKNTTPLDEKVATQALKLLDQIEDLDDVQKVYSNAEFPDAVLMEYAAN
jgi:YebC/PmpR family DNA-binding regulatory protein